QLLRVLALVTRTELCACGGIEPQRDSRFGEYQRAQRASLSRAMQQCCSADRAARYGEQLRESERLLPRDERTGPQQRRFAIVASDGEHEVRDRPRGGIVRIRCITAEQHVECRGPRGY